LIDTNFLGGFAALIQLFSYSVNQLFVSAALNQLIN
jgi:hypothetical protein